MKTILSFFFLCLLESSLYASPLQITLADTINPGTADYIISAIERAKDEKASYLILQLDTPGGLLNSTRHIIQKILASPVPVVVFIGPKGAQAGSAGALITLAADVAAMAPGTNIGAAHPVSSSDEMNKTMSEKITNDTAAFAESLAQAKKRNTEWARRIVTTSVSVTAEEALKIGAIEMMADDVPHLIQKLKGYKLSTPKEVSILPLQEESPHFHPL